MRGKVLSFVHSQFRVRITPAYAGKSAEFFMRFYHAEDHPRLCGEKSLSSSVFKSAPGSPPPMRGKVLLTFPRLALCGITPAYAGKRF